MPRAGLNTLRVVEEAEALADEVGPENLTIASIAGRLGVQPPSLYKHIAGFDAITAQLAVRAKTELGDVLSRTTVGKAGDDAIDALASTYRAWARRYPGRASTAQRAPLVDDDADLAASDRVVQVIFDALAGYGLTGDDAIHATRALRSAMHGFVVLESSNGFGLRTDLDRSYTRMIDALKTAFAEWSRVR